MRSLGRWAHCSAPGDCRGSRHGSPGRAWLLSTLIVVLVISSGHPAWYVGVMLLVVYAIFAITLYLMLPSPTTV